MPKIRGLTNYSKKYNSYICQLSRILLKKCQGAEFLSFVKKKIYLVLTFAKEQRFMVLLKTNLKIILTYAKNQKLNVLLKKI